MNMENGNSFESTEESYRYNIVLSTSTVHRPYRVSLYTLFSPSILYFPLSMAFVHISHAHCVDLFGVTERTVYEDRLHVVVAVTSICFILSFVNALNQYPSAVCACVCVCVMVAATTDYSTAPSQHSHTHPSTRTSNSKLQNAHTQTHMQKAFINLNAHSFLFIGGALHCTRIESYQIRRK